MGKYVSHHIVVSWFSSYLARVLLRRMFKNNVRADLHTSWIRLIVKTLKRVFSAVFLYMKASELTRKIFEIPPLRPGTLAPVRLASKVRNQTRNAVFRVIGVAVGKRWLLNRGVWGVWAGTVIEC